MDFLLNLWLVLYIHNEKKPRLTLTRGSVRFVHIAISSRVLISGYRFRVKVASSSWSCCDVKWVLWRRCLFFRPSLSVSSGPEATAASAELKSGSKWGACCCCCCCCWWPPCCCWLWPVPLSSKITNQSYRVDGWFILEQEIDSFNLSMTNVWLYMDTSAICIPLSKSRWWYCSSITRKARVPDLIKVVFRPLYWPF